MLSEVFFQKFNHTMLIGSIGQSLTDLWNQFNGESLDKETLVARFCKTGTTAIVATNSAQIMVGFVCLSSVSSPITRTEYVEVWALFVSPEARMNGIGTALIEQVKKCTPTASNARFFVSADMAQISFYQKCGYELSGTVRMTRKCSSVGV